MDVGKNTIAPGYFSTLGVALVAGREFTRADDSQSQKTVLINESLARHYFGEASPLGRRMKFGAGKGPLKRKQPRDSYASDGGTHASV